MATPSFEVDNNKSFLSVQPPPLIEGHQQNSSDGATPTLIFVACPMEHIIKDYFNRVPDQIPSYNEVDVLGRSFLGQFIISRLQPALGDFQQPGPRGPTLNPFFLSQVEAILSEILAQYDPLRYAIPILEEITHFYPRTMEGEWKPVGLLQTVSPIQGQNIAEKVAGPLSNYGSFFHLAVYAGYPQIVDALLNRNPGLINQVDSKTQKNPMTIAVCHQRESVIQVLVNHGATRPSWPVTC